MDSSFCKVCHNVCDITYVHVWACVKENAVVTLKPALVSPSPEAHSK